MRSLTTYFVPPITIVSLEHQQPILKMIAHPKLFIAIVFSICALSGRISLINFYLGLQQQPNLIKSTILSKLKFLVYTIEVNFSLILNYR